MKIDRKILFLLSTPLLCVLLCLLAYMILPDQKNFIPDRPEFLTYVDQLSTYSQSIKKGDIPYRLRDVFYRDTIEQAPVTVSMIVKHGSKGYSIINGKRMEPGDAADFFTLVSIDKTSVTIAYNNGAEETVHVKTY
ncbi:MAG: hypothetical protein JXM72_06940 [Deltaproteobacteria bacterium]|nr:hypothetical protein [Deltaproteobacteria bacterium]